MLSVIRRAGSSSDNEFDLPQIHYYSQSDTMFIACMLINIRVTLTNNIL
jgi:hypothetical protein